MSEKHYLEWYYLSFPFCLLSNILCPYAYSIHELLKQLKSDHTKNNKWLDNYFLTLKNFLMISKRAGIAFQFLYSIM